MASASADSGIRSYAVLGDLQVRRGDIAVDLGSPKQRAVLAALILARGAVVSVDRLIDTVWPVEAPAAATTSLQAYISNLRRALRAGASGPSPIERVGTGYRLVVGDDQVDVADFVRLAGSARVARDDGDWSRALAESSAALALWRGDLAGGELGEASWLVAEAAALAETRNAVDDIHISALLAGGDVAGALSEVAALRIRDPLHERTVWLQMVALYRAGRGTEALTAYTDHATMLDAELGLDPGTELVSLQGAILRHDPVIAAWPRPPHWTGSVEVSAPAAETIPARPADPVPPAEARFVGRTPELRRLRDVVSTASPDPRWVLLTGPPGIGKTALAEETVTLATTAHPDATVVWVRCPDTEGVPAWWPLRQACRALGADPAQVLSVPAGSDADTARFAVYDRVQTMLERAAQTAPLIFVVDDLQWADPMSLGLFTYLMSVLRGGRIIVVATARDGEGGPEVQRFRAGANRSGATVVSVPRLSRDEVADLVLVVSQEEMAPADVDLLTRRTGGNPLFVTEFARLTHHARDDEQIPEAIRSILDRRLNSLDPAVLEVIGYAAAIGEDIDVPLLIAVTGRDPDDIADCLDEAVDEHILVTRPQHDLFGAPLPANTTRFAHSLLREGALGMIRPLRRARIHLRIAGVLGEIGGSDSRAVRAAHLVDALPVADAREVVAACRAAAVDATAAWDSEKAAYWLDAALRIYESAPRINQDVTERDDLLMGLLTAQTRAGQVQQALAVVEVRLDEAIAAGAPDTLGRLAGILLRAGGSWPWVGPNVDNEHLCTTMESALDAVAGNGPAEARVLSALAVGYCYHHDASVPAGLLDRADAVAAELGDDAVLVDVLMARLITYSGVAQYAPESIELAARIRHVRSLSHPRSSGTDYAATDVDDVIVDTVLTMSTMMLGDVAETERLVRRGIVGSERYRLPILRAQLRWMEASLAVWHGDFEVAMRHFRTAVKVHQMTELYVAGSDTVAMIGMATERHMLDSIIESDDFPASGQSTLDWARSMADQFSDNQITVLLAAGVAMVARSEGDHDLAERMVAIWLTDDRPMVWTSLCQAVLLAHVVADLELISYAQYFIDYLAPYSTGIGALGQIGCVGPVGLSLAKLHYLLGDDEAGDTALRDATDVAVRGAGRPSLLRCRLLAATRQPPSPQRDREIADIETEASNLGLLDVVKATGALRSR
ncbi:BTAD domain-containing putative transcriptional regulator [Gordonia sp. (in: high G+C Gram-positive bacteria)]|jgi:DNA-binding SARP family transcriptional activator|uniref:BTAD domain-containing putative transcriptional regulator n=1 Tax=Gordonia sp. (in: high G+C Gram-positive bacteria) TaxID=84139 RepID=UPI001D2B5A84|nr:BTAD domain-containing putative transcriptional regulator [Gordonia sp. (in: high G+C Gram-positive bacteria)]MCB1295444.1 AAA family ATPase [Gordonia sp. (in: high G+C Gram-positive bacteria)]HMS76255.1 BTAD domain-containing putative transcriptional regulator [Gordonia sp. (in: high G+C Gram-positive bacteria)]